MKKILFISCHPFFSQNKAGFHHLATAAAAIGHSVYFCTAPNSLLSFIQALKKRTVKLRLLTLQLSFKPKYSNGIHISAYSSLLHDNSKLQFLGKMLKWGFNFGHCSFFQEKNCFDILVFESSPSLFLINSLKKKFKSAKFIYRISDDLQTTSLNSSKNLIKHETLFISLFDKISTPIESLSNRVSYRTSASNIKTYYHAINKKAFIEAKENQSPFSSHLNAVYVGIHTHIDNTFFDLASKLFPKIQFHVIGPVKVNIIRDNIINYGYMNFENTIPYIAHANIGIFGKNLDFSNSNEVIDYQRSLKMIQYTYCRLPILADKRLMSKDCNVFHYQKTNKSIYEAIKKALSFDPSRINVTTIDDWETLLHKIID